VPDLVRDGENGLLRPSGDVSGLAGAVARLKADPGLARRLAENARATVERDFSFAERTKRLMALYEGLISGRRRP
jgi:glycosyltransferase involved in cell wall biosynthesis